MKRSLFFVISILVLSFLLFSACSIQNTTEETAIATETHAAESVVSEAIIEEIVAPISETISSISAETEGHVHPTEALPTVTPTSSATEPTGDYFDDSKDSLGWS